VDIVDRVICRYKQGDAIANPGQLVSTMSGRVVAFGKFERFVREGLEIVGKIRKVRAQDPTAIARGEAKPLWDELLALEPVMPHVRILVSEDFYLWFRDSWELGLSILQQFSLPAPLRRKIEQATKFWATKQNPKLKRDKSLTKEDGYAFTFETYLEQLETVRAQQAAFSEALSKGKPMSEANDMKVKAGPFTLINTGGFKDDVMQGAAEVCEKASRLLTSKGFGKVCYGDVHISKQIGRTRVLAFYMYQSDEMFVRAGVRVNADTLHTVLHEFGHRMHRKFLQSRDEVIKTLYGRYKTRSMFRTIDEGPIDESKLPTIGEEVPYKGDTLVVVKIDRVNRKVRMKPKGELNSMATFSTDITDFNVMFKGEVEKAVRPSGFITQYAGKKPEEMFAEMFAFYCTDELSPAQLADFMPIIE
jgi:hypothetical protein